MAFEKIARGIGNHPAYSAIGTTVAAFVMISSFWGAFSPDPAVPGILGFLTEFNGWEETVRLLLLGFVAGCFGVLVFILLEVRRRPLPPTQETSAPPSHQELAGIRALRSMYRGTGRPAEDALLQLLRRSERDLVSRFPLARLMKYPADGLHDQRSVFNALLGKENVPLRELVTKFRGLLRTYERATECLHDAEHQGIELTEAPYADEYREWEDQHDAYSTALVALFDGGGFDELGDAVEAARKNTKESLRYRVAFRKAHARLQELTPEEDEFLRLFSVSEVRLDPEDSDTWLPYSVYRGGERLAREGILRVAKESSQVELYSLPHPTQRAWFEGGARMASILRGSVEVPLDAVQGSGASGGGARRSY